MHLVFRLRFNLCTIKYAAFNCNHYLKLRIKHSYGPRKCCHAFPAITTSNPIHNYGFDFYYSLVLPSLELYIIVDHTITYSFVSKCFHSTYMFLRCITLHISEVHSFLVPSSTPFSAKILHNLFILGLLPIFGYYGISCYEHPCKSYFVDICFCFF